MDLRWLHVLVAWSMAMSVFVFGFGGGTVTADRAYGSKSDVIQIPLRWCIVKGTKTETSPQSLGEATADAVMLRRIERASDEVWLPGAGIIIRSALSRSLPTDTTFPVIADPVPPVPGGKDVPGDIRDPIFGDRSEFDAVISECRDAWDALAKANNVALEGPIAINIQRFVDPNGNSFGDGRSLTPTIVPSLSSAALCADPTLATSADSGAIVVADASTLQPNVDDGLLLAHEFGIVLNLGEGNGQDDDHDGSYDSTCDSGEFEASSTSSVMTEDITRASDVVTAHHQRPDARAIALVTVGAIVGASASHVFPDCTVIPAHATAGDAASVTVSYGRAGDTVTVDFGAETVSRGMLDGAGSGSIGITIPVGASRGMHVVTVTSTSAILSAVCTLDVKGP